ncbi:hypothetical protein KM043_003891 [Ampulex compressa]|nr:hypothetical protein KM043_003891 [Ampulex compressa]
MARQKNWHAGLPGELRISVAAGARATTFPRPAARGESWKGSEGWRARAGEDAGQGFGRVNRWKSACGYPPIVRAAEERGMEDETSGRNTRRWLDGRKKGGNARHEEERWKDVEEREVRSEPRSSVRAKKTEPSYGNVPSEHGLRGIPREEIVEVGCAAGGTIRPHGRS